MSWICGKCEQEAGKYPKGEKLSEHSRHCPKRTMKISKIEEINKAFDKKFRDKLKDSGGYSAGRVVKDFYTKQILSLIEELEGKKEVCICSAVKMIDGYIVRGHRHNDCYRTLQGMQRWKSGIIGGDVIDGFMTTKNRFVGRKEALRLQKSAGIKSADKEGYRGFELYSEDLY